jgi:hypothetical protein
MTMIALPTTMLYARSIEATDGKDMAHASGGSFCLFFHSNYDANVDGHAILLSCLLWSFELQNQKRSRFNRAPIAWMRPQQALESMNWRDDIAPSPVMVAASSSYASRSARVGDRQSFARLQSELLALVQITSSATSSPDRPDDEEEKTNHNNNNAAAAAAVWFEPNPVSGWTFLHYCASTDDMPTRHWEQLLQHCPVGPVVDDRTATTTPSSFLALETTLGETVVDFFSATPLGAI